MYNKNNSQLGKGYLVSWLSTSYDVNSANCLEISPSYFSLLSGSNKGNAMPIRCVAR